MFFFFRRASLTLSAISHGTHGGKTRATIRCVHGVPLVKRAPSLPVLFRISFNPARLYVYGDGLLRLVSKTWRRQLRCGGRLASLPTGTNGPNDLREVCALGREILDGTRLFGIWRVYVP